MQLRKPLAILFAFIFWLSPISSAHAITCVELLHTLEWGRDSFASPDGTKFFLNTENGPTVIDALTGEVLAQLSTGANAQPVFFDHSEKLATAQNYWKSGTLVATDLKTKINQSLVNFSDNIKSVTAVNENKVLILTGDGQKTRVHYFDLEQKKFSWPTQEVSTHLKMLNAQGDRAILAGRDRLYSLSISAGRITPLPQVELRAWGNSAGLLASNRAHQNETIDKNFVFASFSTGADGTHQAISYEREFQKNGGGALTRSWLEVWDLDQNKIIVAKGRLGNVVSAEYINADRDILIVHDNLIETKDAQTLDDRDYFSAKSPINTSLVFDHEKKVAIAAGNQIKILNAANLQTILSFSTPQEKIERLQVSADGTQLSTLSKDGKVYVWKIEGMQP
jgi:WD40 repeat protein